jgi:phosphatidate cytidylyltransferase
MHIAAVCMAIGAAVAGAPGLALVLLAAGTLVTGGAAVRGQTLPSSALAGFGVLYVGLPAIALVWLRADPMYGFLAVVFLFVIVWTTDTFAYICGTLIRGPKLWPSVSPNKTWAGLVGGIVFAGLAGLLFALLIPLDAGAADGGPQGAGLKLALIGLMLSACAQTGDLAESWLKRTFQVKNASTLIPGHGGFMDRLDGVVAAATLAGLIALASDGGSPARALLFW